MDMLTLNRKHAFVIILDLGTFWSRAQLEILNLDMLLLFAWFSHFWFDLYLMAKDVRRVSGGLLDVKSSSSLVLV